MIAETFDALAKRDLWVVWKTVARGGKPTKVPYAIDGRSASSTNPETWSTLAETRSTTRSRCCCRRPTT